MVVLSSSILVNFEPSLAKFAEFYRSQSVAFFCKKWINLQYIMALVLGHVEEFYSRVNNDYSGIIVIMILHNVWLINFGSFLDPRVKEWLFMSDPFTIVIIVITYLYFVLKIGPVLMKNRAAFNIDQILKYYNIFQVVVCAGMFFQVLTSSIYWFRLITSIVKLFVGIQILLWKWLQHIMSTYELFAH